MRALELANTLLSVSVPEQIESLGEPARFVAHNFVAHLVMKCVVDPDPLNPPRRSLLQGTKSGCADIYKSRPKPANPVAVVKLALEHRWFACCEIGHHDAPCATRLLALF